MGNFNLTSELNVVYRRVKKFAIHPKYNFPKVLQAQTS